MSEEPRNRRIDRVLDASYTVGLPDLSLEELRDRRDECLAEREYLSLLRRLLQGRAEILRAEVELRASKGGPNEPSLVDRLATILADEDHPSTSRGEFVRVVLPDEELLLARRRVERLVNDVQLSDTSGLDDAAIAAAIAALGEEEAAISASRRRVFDVLDAVQDELKRRYKDDPSLALR